MARIKVEKTETEAIIESLEKKYGLAKSRTTDTSIVDTGSIQLNRAMQIGGTAVGKIVEILGMESSGKSTITLHQIAEYQKAFPEKKVALFDYEHSYDRAYAKTIGVDSNSLLIYQPDYMEQGYDMILGLIAKDVVSCVVIDSQTAAPPKVVFEGEMGDSVTFDTPVYIKDKVNGYVDIVAISDLYNGQKEISHNRLQACYKKNKRIQILTHEGWKDIKTVFYKKNKNRKPICITHTSNGLVKSTYDHCLFVDGLEVTAKELKEGDKLDMYVPEKSNRYANFITEDIAWLLGQWVSDGTIFEKNHFVIADTNIEIIEKLKRIIDESFITQTKIKVREYNDGIRKPIYILSATRCNELDLLVKSCVSKNSNLKKIPKIILNSSDKIKLAFLQGFREGDGTQRDDQYSYFNKSMPVIAGIQYLTREIGIDTNLTINKACPENLMLNERKDKMFDDGTIKSFVEIGSPDFLYDIETETGTFISALGNIVIHNSTIGLQARINSKFCQKVKGLLALHNTTLFVVSQLREKIGGMGDPTITTGGLAYKFYADVRWKLWKTANKENEVNITTIDVIKSKVGKPFGQAKIGILWGIGFDKVGEIIDYAIDFDIIQKSGSWFSYGETKLGQGVKTIKTLFNDNPEFAVEIKEKVMNKLMNTKIEEVEVIEEDE